ncbi:hypothetical protein G9464_20895 [Halostella sp. JP-L12]|uniref:hypothetical protein n=1 Tax=Halostella TaxID=1843185 RepID=UPI000EF7CA6C|nr:MULTISPECIES: hypothetical protein [Halostella]NHN50030.1 hypothetical protein [Halostella sp. JP-L12]
MDSFGEGRANPVRNTTQVYFPSDLADDLPFDPGDTVRQRVLEDYPVVVLWPEGELPAETMVIDPPDPHDLPWPLASIDSRTDLLTNTENP